MPGMSELASFWLDKSRCMGASSDYLLLDVTAAQGGVHIGDEVACALNYSALLAVLISQYVDKRFLHHEDHAKEIKDAHRRYERNQG